MRAHMRQHLSLPERLRQQGIQRGEFLWQELGERQDQFVRNGPFDG